MSGNTDHPDQDDTAARAHPAAILVSLEPSRRTWLATSLSPDSEKLSKHVRPAGDGKTRLEPLAGLKAKAERRTQRTLAVVTIHKAGLDGFWRHRLLERNGIDRHVVEPASIAVPRRHRRAKTAAIDGAMRIRTLAAWSRGERADVRQGAAAEPRGGGPPPAWSRAGPAAEGAQRAHPSDQGPAVRARHRRR